MLILMFNFKVLSDFTWAAATFGTNIAFKVVKPKQHKEAKMTAIATTVGISVFLTLMGWMILRLIQNRS
jgi:hypothetical protein